MFLMQHEQHTRRAFLRRSGQMALMGAAAPLGLNLAAMGEAAAFTANDYKALVCVFLFGGNDYANTVVTYDAARHQAYERIRMAGAGTAAGSIAIARARLEATRLQPTVPLAGGAEYALHPSMGGLAGLFNAGQAAVQLNVGPLVTPTTRQQYAGNTVPLPPKLFSHNDQQSVWQSQGAEGSTRGWGGNIGDLALSSNGNALFTCISVTGNTVFLAGRNAMQYQCSTAGPVAIKATRGAQPFFYEPAMRAAFTEHIQQTRSHMLENEYNAVMRRGIAAEGQVSGALGGVALNTPFPANNPLAAQLRMVARLIGARNALGLKRQVFMASLGGFDLHDDMVGRQPAQLAQVSEAITAFYRATVELGIADKVTTFTASDFGRTLTSNGDGTDHGWGSHHLVVGGGVRGKAFYGTPPPVSVGDTGAPQDQWHIGQGRLLPSTSVDQFGATLGKWFGVSATELPAILPNIGHFGGGAYPVDVGFMAAA
ncbi:DUF1501 domain-containing protein [Acidovorax sp.]|uniref:DUF1501 domain-containing protein n=1 Tax=Acidovorax sp. TaxID=1872122 RepID=UPI00391F24F3